MQSLVSLWNYVGWSAHASTSSDDHDGAPPSTSANAPPAFPPLPAELVLRILHYTLPPASHSTHTARTSRLRALALLSRDCARWASLELRRDVRLETHEHARWFLREVLRRRGREWAGGVRVLRLGRESDEGGQGDAVWRSSSVGRTVKDLLRMCENVEELWVCGLSGLQPGDLAPAHPTLHLRAVIFTGHALTQLLDTATLPFLRHVEYHSVHQSLVPPRAAPSPDPAAVPGGASTLAAITANLAALRPSSSSSSPAVEHPLVAFAPRLHTLSLTDLAFRSFPSTALDALLAHAPLLRGLSLPPTPLLDGGGVADALAACPSLVALRLSPKHPRHTAGSSRLGSTATAVTARTAGWRDAAFDLVAQAVPAAPTAAPGPHEGVAAHASVDAGCAPLSHEDVRERARADEALRVALDVLERAGRGGTVTVSAASPSDESTGQGVGEAGARAVGARVVVEREGCVPAANGPWRIDAARWRERLELL
ncbi:hypothetical protein JCM8208_005129 [Rhodotorula glutinis]